MTDMFSKLNGVDLYLPLSGHTLFDVGLVWLLSCILGRIRQSVDLAIQMGITLLTSQPEMNTNI